jgi:hypothetical protein
MQLRLVFTLHLFTALYYSLLAQLAIFKCNSWPYKATWTQQSVRCLYSCCYMTWVVQWLRLALSKGPNKVDVSLPSPEDRNRPSFRNIVFSTYLEFLTMAKIHKPSDSEWYTPSSEPLDSSRIRVHFSHAHVNCAILIRAPGGGGGRLGIVLPFSGFLGNIILKKIGYVPTVNSEGLWTLVLALSMF